MQIGSRKRIRHGETIEIRSGNGTVRKRILFVENNKAEKANLFNALQNAKVTKYWNDISAIQRKRSLNSKTSSWCKKLLKKLIEKRTDEINGSK